MYTDINITLILKSILRKFLSTEKIHWIFVEERHISTPCQKKAYKSFIRKKIWSEIWDSPLRTDFLVSKVVSNYIFNTKDSLQNSS